jgi:cytochrome P450
MAHQASFTPTALLLPWFPSPTKKAGKNAATELFTMLYTYVEKRRRTEPTNDAIDILIADGEATKKIVGVCFIPRVV